MAKSREKVQQIGLWDTEVSKPDHDAVCLWAYRNADLILRAVCPERFDKPWLRDEVELGSSQDHEQKQERERLARTFIEATPRPNPRITGKTLEFVLKRHTGYQDRTVQIVGYADLLIETELPCIHPKFREWAGTDIFDGFAQGWTNVLNCCYPSVRAPCILVEAKSVMPTVGDLMRQINLYRTAFAGKVVVVSPDDCYADILDEQGVTFVKYAP